jgi:Bax protein
VPRSVRAWLAAALALACLPALGAEQVLEIRSARELEALFVRLNYTPKDWQAGVRTVPRIYLAEIPRSWREKSSKEISVEEKKRLFFRLLAPVVLYVNERILEERVRVEALSRQTAQGRPLSPSDQAWLRELAAHYQVTPDRTDELLRRVDLVPPSLALAQGASESGWGTSRFANEGNSLFGQWSWSGGIKPSEQRTAAHGDHRIAAFESTGMSVASYALNLNTHASYRDLRARREDLRRQGRPLRGQDLVDTMIHYSERGQAYVNELKALMRQNKLEVADEATLRKMEIIRIVPKPQAN